MIYWAGRIFQLIGLLAMPTAIWIAEFQRNERAAIGMFLGSFFIFAAGYFLTKFSGRT